VVANIERKERDAAAMAGEMVRHMSVQNVADLASTTRGLDSYARETSKGRAWTLHLGDCVEVAREAADEKHIAPLQLEVIRRAVRLWTNPGDLVCSPFAGIGSEGYVALQEGRRFVGAELKRSYWQQAVANLRRAELYANAPRLFDMEVIAD
jgi:DNA modification methylase